MPEITRYKTFAINKPGTDQLAFKLSEVDLSMPAAQKPAYFDYYSVFWVREGEGEVKIDFGKHRLTQGRLMFLLPYQPFVLEDGKTFKGTLIEFSSDFFCIEKHRYEVSCNGVLFNSIYGPPFLEAGIELGRELQSVLNDMYDEFGKGGLSQEEMLFAYLKIFLIKASREKIAQIETETSEPVRTENALLISFQDLIEEYFIKQHGVAFYADKLFIQPNTLSKLTRRVYSKTPGEIIKERIMVEAKRRLYLTKNSVKEISYGLGFDDPAYFNRFFKKWAQITPEEYRQRLQ